MKMILAVLSLPIPYPNPLCFYFGLVPLIPQRPFLWNNITVVIV